MSKKAWIIFAVICIVLLGGLIYVSVKNRIDVSDIDQNKVQPAMASNGEIADHVSGKKDSKVILVEYGDFQCPYCSESFPNVKKVTDKYKDQITYVFRNQPLTTLHQNALAAAAAAESAGLQGKFWEMHDLLYRRQNDWSNLSGTALTDRLVSYAQELGIKTDKFKTDLSDPRIQKKINFDRALYAKFSNSPSTPTFVLNGKEVDSDIVQDTIKNDGAKLDAAIAEALKK